MRGSTLMKQDLDAYIYSNNISPLSARNARVRPLYELSLSEPDGVQSYIKGFNGFRDSCSDKVGSTGLHYIRLGDGEGRRYT